MELQEFKDKIVVGKVLNNMELVELLGTEAQKEAFKKNNKLYANTKKALLRELERLCNFKEIKVKNKVNYVILKIFAEQKERNYKENARNSKGYIDLIETLIINKLDKNNGTLIYTNSLLFNNLGMVNNNYIDKLLTNKTALEKKNINYNNFLLFDSILRKGFGKIVDRCLKNLNNRRVISYTKSYFASVELIENKEYKILELPEDISNFVREVEHKELKKYKDNSLKKVTLADIFFKKKEHEFYSNVNAKIKDCLEEYLKQELLGQKFNFNYYFTASVIKTSGNTIALEKEEYYYKQTMQKLNTLAKNYMLNNTNNKNTYPTKIKSLVTLQTEQTKENLIDAYNANALELIKLFIN